MMRVIRSMSELPFGNLMEIYSQSNRLRGQQWGSESEERQIALAEQEFYAYLRQCFFALPDSCYYLWEEQGRAVSALRCESYGNDILLTGLETTPDCRGNGCATALLKAVLQNIGSGNVYVHIQRDNLPSLAVHRRCGFQKVKAGARLLDGSYLKDYDTYLVKL